MKFNFDTYWKNALKDSTEYICAVTNFQYCSFSEFGTSLEQFLRDFMIYNTFIYWQNYKKKLFKNTFKLSSGKKNCFKLFILREWYHTK